MPITNDDETYEMMRQAKAKAMTPTSPATPTAEAPDDADVLPMTTMDAEQLDRIFTRMADRVVKAERERDILGNQLRPMQCDSPHPEATCEACKGPNVVWFAPNELWNVATDGQWSILCPVCFITRAELRGINKAAWKIEPENASMTTSPSPSPSPSPTASTEKPEDRAARLAKRVAKTGRLDDHAAMLLAEIESNEAGEFAEAITIAQRLCLRTTYISDLSGHAVSLLRDAVLAQAKALARVTEALKPFADMAALIPQEVSENETIYARRAAQPPAYIYVSDLRRARCVLGDGEG